MWLTVIISKNTDDNNKRQNFIIDMSGYHLKEGKFLLDPMIFPKSMSESLTLFPKKSIQKSGTCGLWLCSIINCLLEKENYSNLDEIINSTNNNSINFIVDVISIFSKKIYKQIILGSQGIFDDIKIIENDFYYCEFNLCFTKEAIKNFFFNLYTLIYCMSFTGLVNSEFILFLS